VTAARRRPAGSVLVASAVLSALALAGCGTGPAASGAASTSSGATSTAAAAPGGSASTADDDPARFATQVKASAGRAGINPQLLMAILYNESYKPHDPAFERAWHSLDPDSAFGVANMHRKAFEDARRGRAFADRKWEELPDDPALAIEAAGWYVHDLAARLPARWTAPFSRDDLLALGYDAGPGNMLAFARGAKLLPDAADYLSELHGNWAAAGEALKQG
jgi:hypothetical protein